MRLLDLFREVKEEKLEKWQLEEYRNELADLYSKMQLELADLKKKKAMYRGSFEGGEKMTEINRKWEASPDGQREIEVKGYIRATAPILSSLRDRLYQVY